MRDFEVEHEKRMHVIVVRRDGQGFQHVHPVLGGDGVWRVELTLPDAGAYRVFADFKHDGEAQTLAADLAVDGEADYQPLPAPATTRGRRRRLPGAPRVPTPCAPSARPSSASPSPAPAGRSAPSPTWARAVTSWPCARATSPTSTCIRRSDGEAVSFMTEFPSEGRYRLYLQFKHEGRVHTAAFTQEVAR